jgi:cysteine-rich repeat protein
MVNGQCSSSACPVGQYLAKPGCTNCLKWCENCTGPSDCSKCTSGFEWNSTCNQCEETCGDGRKFVLACDDGNLKDGDGCSSKCTIEPGYMCVGGGPYSPDMCFCPEASKNGKPAGSTTQPLALSLKTPPKTTVSNCVFTITVLPEIKTYNDDSKGNPALIAAKSRSMIKMSFLGDKISKLSGSCSQQPRALDTWTCTVSYDNQPPSSMFAVVLLATTTDGRTASMNVVVQPPKHS